MDMNVGTPEIIWFCLVAINLLIALAKDGEPRTGKHNLAGTMLAFGLSFGLLYWGGFFS